MFARTRCCLACFSLCFLLVPAALAQKYIPRSITFSGYAGASQAELLAATGLAPGVALGQPEIQAAAQKLDNTGLFSDIRFSFNGVELHYTLKPADGAAPVIYANFPWWKGADLTAAVAAKVPLFHGSVVPESGLQNEVVAALTTLVREKGVSATVTAMPNTNDSGQTVGVTFRIDSPPVQVGAVTFTGAGAQWAAPLAAIEKAAAGQDYGVGTKSTLEAALKAVYHRKGYLDVSLDNFAYGQPQFTNGKVTVPVSAAINEGAQYRLAGLRLSGDVLMKPDEFAKQAKLHTGDVVDEDLLRQTLANVAWPYKAKGYLRAAITADPVFDRAKHTVDYSITVTPGPVFQMGKLTLVNLAPDQQALVMKYWALHSGDVYDATYPPSFLNRNKNTLHALDGWSASYKEYAHLDTHIVDLVITFRPGGALN
jgi:outer membrane protein assembly factor BamA